MIFQCFPLQCSPFSNSGILRSVSRTPYHLLPATLGLRAKVSTLGGASCSQQESSSASIPQKALQTLKCLKTLSRKSINWPKKQEHLYIYILHVLCLQYLQCLRCRYHTGICLSRSSLVDNCSTCFKRAC